MDSSDSSMDDLLRGLVGRIDALEAACSDLASRVEALQSDYVRLNRKVDGLTRGESTADKSRKRSKTEHLVLTTLGNDATVHLASFLGATDFASLGRTCGHFGRSCVGSDGQMTSLVEDLAGQVVYGSATDYEKSVLVGETQIKKLHELELMRLPLYFQQLIGSGNAIRYPQPEDKSIISVSYSDDGSASVISNHVMRTGRHYVTFFVCGVTDPPLRLEFGVIRPIKDWDKKGLDNFDPTCFSSRHHKHREQLLAERTEQWGNDLHCCIYNNIGGKCYHSSWSDEDQWRGDEWEGMEPLLQTGQPIGDMNGYKVGLLLDLNSGTLSVFKDGRMLGVMKEGLTGAYCWCFCGHTCEVKIERGMPHD